MLADNLMINLYCSNKAPAAYRFFLKIFLILINILMNITHQNGNSAHLYP